MKIVSWMKGSGAASIRDDNSFNKVATKRAKIFGLSHKNEWIPQGMNVLPNKNGLIIAHYAGKGEQASILSITNTKTNKLVKTLYLYESSTKKHTGHVGGVAITGSTLYVNFESGAKKYLPGKKLSINHVDNINTTKLKMS